MLNMLPSKPNQTPVGHTDNGSGQCHYQREIEKSQDSSDISTSLQSYLKEHGDAMPPELKVGYIDVLILYHEGNRKEAEEFRDHLLNEIQLPNGEKVRALLYDEGELYALNNRKIGQLGEAMNRSTFVFIYLTKEFIHDKWMEFSSEVCLMEAIENPDKQWCVVPVFTEKRNATFKIPQGINVLNGLNYYSKNQYYLIQVTSLIVSRIQARKDADDRLKTQQIEWITNRKEDKTLPISTSETSNEFTTCNIPSSNESTIQVGMRHSNEEMTALKSRSPDVQSQVQQYSDQKDIERVGPECAEQQSSDPVCSTTSTLHCDMVMSSPMSQQFGTHGQTDLPNTCGKKEEELTADSSLYEELNLQSFDIDDHNAKTEGTSMNPVDFSTAAGGENKTTHLLENTRQQEQTRSSVGKGKDCTSTTGALQGSALIPRFAALLNSDTASCSETGNQSKNLSENTAEHSQPNTPTSVNQNEELNIQDGLPLLSACDVATPLHNAERERNTCRNEPSYDVHDSGKINRDATPSSSTVINHFNTTIITEGATYIQIGGQNMIKVANYSPDSDDETNKSTRQSQQNPRHEEEMDYRNNGSSNNCETDVEIPSPVHSHSADEQRMHSPQETLPSLGAHVDKNGSCKADAAAYIQHSQVEMTGKAPGVNGTLMKEDGNRYKDFKKECIIGTSEHISGPREFSKPTSPAERENLNRNRKKPLIKKTTDKKYDEVGKPLEKQKVLVHPLPKEVSEVKSSATFLQKVVRSNVSALTSNETEVKQVGTASDQLHQLEEDNHGISVSKYKETEADINDQIATALDGSCTNHEQMQDQSHKCERGNVDSVDAQLNGSRVKPKWYNNAVKVCQLGMLVCVIVLGIAKM